MVDWKVARASIDSVTPLVSFPTIKAASAFKRLRGYTSAIGDNGRAIIRRSGGSSNLLCANVNYWIFENLILDGQNAGLDNFKTLHYTIFRNCISYNAGNNGFHTSGSYNVVHNCWAYNNIMSGFIAGDPASYNHCLANANTLDGFGVNGMGFFNNCIAYNNSRYGWNTNRLQIIKSISHLNGQAEIIANAMSLISDTHIQPKPNCYAIKLQGVMSGVLLSNVNIYGASVDYKYNVIPTLNYNETNLDPQFNNVANLDFTRIGSNLDSIGFNNVGTQSFDYKNAISIDNREQPTFPAVTDVRNGIDRGDGNLGTLDLPSVNDVEKGVTFDNVTKTGTFKKPETNEVKKDIQYGANDVEFTGTLESTDPGINNVLKDVNYKIENIDKVGTFDESSRNIDPGENNIKDGVTYKIQNVNKEGNLTQPSESDVRNGIKFGANDTEFTGTCKVPTKENVRDGINVDVSDVGKLDLPSENDVEDGVQFDNLTKEGNLVVPTQSNVKKDVEYGSNGTEKTGTLESTDPGINNVIKDITYKIESVNKIGIFDENARNIDPGENNVEDGVSYKIKNINKEGNLKQPSELDVRDGIGYGGNGTEKTGTLDLPSTHDVEKDVKFDGNTKTGEFVVPAENKVEDGTKYGYNNEFEGTDELERNLECPLSITLEKDGEINVSVEIDQ